MLLVAIATYIMNIFDMICTMYLVKEYGDDIEGNPIGKILLKNKPITVIVKLFCMAAVLTLLYILSVNTVFFVLLWLVFGVYILLTIYHLVILIHLKVHHI